MLHHMFAPRAASSRRLVAAVPPVATKIKQQVYFISIQHECLLGTEINLCQEK